MRTTPTAVVVLFAGVPLAALVAGCAASPASLVEARPVELAELKIDLEALPPQDEDGLAHEVEACREEAGELEYRLAFDNPADASVEVALSMAVHNGVEGTFWGHAVADLPPGGSVVVARSEDLSDTMRRRAAGELERIGQHGPDLVGCGALILGVLTGNGTSAVVDVLAEGRFERPAPLPAWGR